MSVDVGSRLAVVLGVGLAACSSRPTVVSGEPAARPALDVARVRRASVLVRGRDPTPDELRRWSSDDATAGDVVDAMLGDPFLSDVVAPLVLFKNNLLRPGRQVVLGGYALASAPIAGKRVFYLHRPCGPKAVVTVRPWWDLEVEVAVCADAIRADVWETALPDGKRMSCDADLAGPAWLPSTECGCGPNLIRCLPREEALPFVRAAIEEVRATTAHIVANDQPLERLFVGNESKRDRRMEQIYLRGIAEGKRLADPEPLLRTADRWPEQGKLAPRQEVEPGQHAGVLTAPQIVYHVFDPRQRMRIIYEVMWCAGEAAPGALPEDLLSLHTADLSQVNAGWEELARRPICTDCHARLDYGMQFFRGWPSPSAVSWHFVAGATAGARGPLYGSGAADRRGVGPLTPQSFARLATAQPEFARCMARDVAEYVYGPRVTADDVDRLAASVHGKPIIFRSLVRSALIDYLECASCSVGGGEPPGRSPAIEDLVGEDCTSCHHEGANILRLEGRLDGRTRVKIADQVLFGRMPPGRPLPLARRYQFLTAAFAAVPAGDELDRAVAVLRAHADPPAALPLLTANAYIQSLTGQQRRPFDGNALEVSLDGRDTIFTPGYAALIALETHRACKSGQTSQTGKTVSCFARTFHSVVRAAHEPGGVEP